MMANTIAARKREPGAMVMVSSATGMLPSGSMPILTRCSAYGTAPDDACASLKGGGPSPRVFARSRIAQSPNSGKKKGGNAEGPTEGRPYPDLSRPLAAEHVLPEAKAEGRKPAGARKLRLDLLIALFRCKFPSCICVRSSYQRFYCSTPFFSLPLEACRSCPGWHRKVTHPF